ncbi:MAG: hypothetical protein ACKVP0_16755 [Pirellulaceae bacterium]
MAASFSGLTMAAFTLKVFPNDFWFSVALPIVGWFLLQPPLWMFSLGWKYSLQLPESPQQNSSPQMQFTLAHMLLWTLCVALILGISRMALRDVQVSSGPNWRMEDLWPFLIFLIVNFLLAISVTSAMLGLQKLLHRGLAAVTCSLMLGVLHGLCITIMRPGGLSTDGLCSIIWLHFVHGSVLVGSLFVLTAVGYRWQRDAIPPDRAVQSWDASR